MKKHAFPIFLTITCIFAAFTLGVFLGRNHSKDNIMVSNIQTVPRYANDSPTVSAEDSPAPSETISFPIDINSATQKELMALPGIGETLAQRILDYRTQHGNFPSTAELLNVEGIGTVKFEAILDLITTGG